MTTRCELCEQQGRRQRLAEESRVVVCGKVHRILVCLNDGNRFLEISEAGAVVGSFTENDSGGFDWCEMGLIPEAGEMKERR